MDVSIIILLFIEAHNHAQTKASHVYFLNIIQFLGRVRYLYTYDIIHIEKMRTALIEV